MIRSLHQKISLTILSFELANDLGNLLNRTIAMMNIVF